MPTDLASQRPPLTSLSDEEIMFRDAVAAFAEAEVRPRVHEMDRVAKLDPALIPQCFELGLMGIEIPEQYGGAGGSLIMVTLAVEEISRFDASVAILVDVQNTLVNYPIARYGNEEQKSRYLTQLTGGKVGAYALSESGSGSDAFGLATRAEQHGADPGQLRGAGRQRPRPGGTRVQDRDRDAQRGADRHRCADDRRRARRARVHHCLRARAETVRQGGGRVSGR